MRAMTTRARWQEHVRSHVVELLIVGVLVFLGARLVMPFVTGERVAAREREVGEVLRAIHAAEQQAHGGESGRFRWLSELVAAAVPGDPLAALRPLATPAEQVEAFTGMDHVFVLFVGDPGRNDDRAWSPAAATDQAGASGYGAFAWPLDAGDDVQWAWYVDHRGKLLGSWNHDQLFDGFEPPFPPAAHPLRDYFQAQREGEDGAWFLFESLAEILP